MDMPALVPDTPGSLGIRKSVDNARDKRRSGLQETSAPLRGD